MYRVGALSGVNTTAGDEDDMTGAETDPWNPHFTDDGEALFLMFMPQHRSVKSDTRHVCLNILIVCDCFSCRHCAQVGHCMGVSRHLQPCGKQLLLTVLHRC